MFDSVSEALSRNFETYKSSKRNILRAGGVLGELRDAGTEFLKAYPNCELSCMLYGSSIHLHVRLGRFDSLKDAAPIMTPLADWKCSRSADETSFNFEFVTGSVDAGTQLKVYVYVWPHYASAKCKKVLVGEENIPEHTEEKYKLVCVDEDVEDNE